MMNDAGTNVRLLVSGSYEEPFLAADGTVLFTSAYSLLFPSGNVCGYKDGAISTLASEFSGAADGMELGHNGIFAFKNVLQYNLDILRRDQIGSAATTASNAGNLPTGDSSSSSGGLLWYGHSLPITPVPDLS